MQEMDDGGCLPRDGYEHVLQALQSACGGNDILDLDAIDRLGPVIGTRLFDADTNYVPTDPCPPPPRVRYRLSPQEDRPACLRWLAVRQLRQGPRRPCLPDRGAEDRQEGPQGVPAEEALSGQHEGLRGNYTLAVGVSGCVFKTGLRLFWRKNIVPDTGSSLNGR